jgi:glycosyltransferase involved in cell wall biosynthesis
MAIHQLVPSFVLGDAIGHAAVLFRAMLRRLGHHGEIYAGEVDPRLASLVKPSHALRPAPADLVLYHHGIASPLSGELLHLPCQRGVVYHNITPAHFYQGTLLWEPLVSGRSQLAAMAPYVDLAIGVSQFNSAELAAVGYRNVHTVPLFVEPRRFREENVDRPLSSQLTQPSPAVVAVSRVMAHKRFEDLLALHQELLRLSPNWRLLIAGPYQSGGSYFRKLHRQSKSLPGVRFLGRLSHAQLVSTYRAGTVFVSMSEHEGFGLPLLEAMAADLPVVAFAAAAVPETLGGSGIAFTEKRFAFLAELVEEVRRNASLRRQILAGEKRRLRTASATRATHQLGRALSGLIPPETRLVSTPARSISQGWRAVAPRGNAGRKAGKRPRVAIVVQRYGEVSGGAEQLARAVVEHLRGHWDITVLTSCARDHLTWANEFPPGETNQDGIRILRFPALRTRDMLAFNALSLGLYRGATERVREEHWIWEQGPQLTGLLEHLSESAAQYDGFVFFTYLYLPTVWGLPMVAGRSLLVPTAHDEPAFRFESYGDVFEMPRALFCSTPEESDLVRRRFAEHAPVRVVGAGVDPVPAKGERFRRKFGIRRPYLFYVGRVEEGKGVPHLVRHHAALRRHVPEAPELVLAGASSLNLEGTGVRYLGRISEQDKQDGIAGATAVAIPSRYESLSLLALEAFAQGTPVLVNGESAVLAGQVRRSGAGATYRDSPSFIEGARRIAAARVALSRKALLYARKHSWSKVVSAYREEMQRIVESRA